jgi:Ulp1 family protease
MAKTRPDKNGVAKIQPEQIGKNDNVEPKKEAFSFDEQYVSEFMVDMLSEKNDYKEMGKISKGDPITIRDLQTLQADMYVNDTIINTYIQLVVNETNTPENPTKVRLDLFI